nr:TonB-dependent receptor [Jiulongibacter sediminis]
MILVNDKPTQIDAATILSQIPVNTIEKIEMITAPSDRYDADGKAGIINIVTKKGSIDGISLSTNLQYGLPRIKEYFNAEEPQRYGADVSLNYRKNKLDLGLALNYLRNDIAGRRVGDVNTTIGDIFTSFPSEGERSLKRENYGFRAPATYYLNDKNELNAGAYLGHRDQYRLADIYYNNTKTDLNNNTVIGQSQYFNSNLVLKSGTFKVFNLDYLHRFDETSSLSLSALYENALIEGWTKNRNLTIDNFNDTLQYTLNNGYNPLKAFRAKIDYEKTVVHGKLSVGYQLRNQLQDRAFDYLEKEENDEAFVVYPEFTGSISVLNRIHGLYPQYAGQVNKLKFSGRLRFENAYRRFSDDRGGEPFELPLSNLFPSASLRYNFSDTWALKAAYSRRVQRSTNNELNPYPEREHSETLEQGDPRIRPEFIGLYEVGLSKDFKKATFYWNIYHQNIQDIVNRVNSVYNDTILNRIYTNAGRAKLTGSDLGATLSPIKNLKAFLGGNIYNLEIRGFLFENALEVSSRGWVYAVYSNISYQITTKASLT